MTKISVKIENTLVDKIEEDRINKGLKLSKWVTNAIQSYLHPSRTGIDQGGKT
jgi:metal-responsive CopG/Arc/MetJ family transcriptional regulator